MCLYKMSQRKQWQQNVNAPGGYLITPDRESWIRGIGRIEDIEALNR